MKKSLSNTLTLVLASLGGFLALALTVEHYRPTTLPCSVHGNGCGTTLTSSYAQVGPIPTALFGAAMYAVIAILCVLRHKQLTTDRQQEVARARAYATAETDGGDATPIATLTPERDDPKSAIRSLDLAIWTLAFLGFGISWWLQYTSIFVIFSFCPYCFTSALLVTAIFLLATRDAWVDGRDLTGEQKMLGGVVGFVLLMLLFIIVPDAMHQIELNKRELDTKPITIMESLRDVVLRHDLNTTGDPKAKYTLVEFADYFCPHCAEAAEHLLPILKAHPDMKLAFRNYVLGFPNPKFQHSDKAALAAEAAARQGKFWEMHDYLFQHQKQMQDTSFTDANFVEYARDLGLDTAKFAKDMDDTKLLSRVIQDHDDGDAGGITMTPTFFLVSPDKVTRFVGNPELDAMMKNPGNDAWK
jgi:protein-disulfide isomerase/uncharacterized membrane protein